MLTRLYIRNFGLIDQAELELGPGLSVITGETGAGKSMLIDALSVCAGAKTKPDMVRHGAGQAAIEAGFEVGDTHPVAILLEEAGVDIDEGEVVLRRVIPAEGRAKAFVNGLKVNQEQLKNIGEVLVDIHGQHDQQMLLKPSRHVDLLDHFGHLLEQRQALRNSWRAWREAQKKLEEAQSRIANREQEETLINAYLQELDELAYEAGEEETLSQDLHRLKNAGRTLDALSAAAQALNGDGGVSECLGSAQRAVQDVADGGQDEELTALNDRLWSLYTESSELARDVEGLQQLYDPDPERLQALDDRLNALRDCARKHRVEVSGLSAVHQKLAEKSASLFNLGDDIAALEREANDLYAQYTKQCHSLAASRQKAAQVLQKKVEEQMQHLKMPHTRFEAELLDLPEEEWGQNGAQRVQFMVSVNPGSPLAPLNEAASGGEISRLMLALKVVFYREHSAISLVFDEVDTGIGGAVAQAVGQALRQLGQRQQVFAITHQPQVAALGERHIRIEKHVSGEQTQTQVLALDTSQREEEIARMLAGETITDEARHAAVSLVKEGAALR